MVTLVGCSVLGYTVFYFVFVVYCSTGPLLIVRCLVMGRYSYVVELLVVFVIAGTLLV